MSADEKCGVLQDCAVEGIFVEALGIKLKVCKGWARMSPVNVVHDVAKAAYRAITSGGDLGCFLVQEVVDIYTALLGFRLFCLTETVAVPAHDKTGLKRESLVLPNVRNGVAVNPNAAVGVGGSAGSIEFVLPETAPKHTGLVWLTCINANHSKLTVSATYDNGRSFGKAGCTRSFCRNST